MQVQTIPAPRSVGAASSTTTSALTPRIDGTGQVPAIAPLASAVVAPQREPAGEAPQAASIAPAGNPFLEPGLQQAVAAGQQAQAWLSDLDQKLQDAKGSLAGLLSGGARPGSTGGNAEGRAAQSLQQFGAAWQQRSAQAGGMLDGQLRVLEPGQARQAFTLRGLDIASLGPASQEGSETLSFAVAGSSAPIAVAIDPGQGIEASVQRLDQAMAPAGLRVAIVAGKLQWSTGEAQWPALREGLSVKGEGRRFPSGQRVRVRVDAQAEAIQPGSWSLDGVQAQRQTLGRMIAAQALLRDAGAALDRKLAAVRLPEPADTARQGPLLLGAAQDFKARAVQPVYENFAELAPLLRGVRRDQVRALLSR